MLKSFILFLHKLQLEKKRAEQQGWCELAQVYT